MAACVPPEIRSMGAHSNTVVFDMKFLYVYKIELFVTKKHALSSFSFYPCYIMRLEDMYERTVT